MSHNSYVETEHDGEPVNFVGEPFFPTSMGPCHGFRSKLGPFDMSKTVLNQGTTKKCSKMLTNHRKSRASHAFAPEQRPAHLCTSRPCPIPPKLPVFMGSIVELKEKMDRRQMQEPQCVVSIPNSGEKIQGVSRTHGYHGWVIVLLTS